MSLFSNGTSMCKQQIAYSSEGQGSSGSFCRFGRPSDFTYKATLDVDEFKLSGAPPTRWEDSQAEEGSNPFCELNDLRIWYGENQDYPERGRYRVKIRCNNPTVNHRDTEGMRIYIKFYSENFDRIIKEISIPYSPQCGGGRIDEDVFIDEDLSETRHIRISPQQGCWIRCE